MWETDGGVDVVGVCGPDPRTTNQNVMTRVLKRKERTTGRNNDLKSCLRENETFLKTI